MNVFKKICLIYKENARVSKSEIFYIMQNKLDYLTLTETFL